MMSKKVRQGMAGRKLIVQALRAAAFDARHCPAFAAYPASLAYSVIKTGTLRGAGFRVSFRLC
jgi:hypothetical protein